MNDNEENEPEQADDGKTKKFMDYLEKSMRKSRFGRGDFIKLFDIMDELLDKLWY